MRERCEAEIPFRWLLDHEEGTLRAPRRERVEQHLETGCVSCESALAGIEGTLTALAEGTLDPPPRAVARKAKRLLSRARRAETFRRILATLVFDQRLEVAPALRSGGGVTRRILFAAGEHELFLTLSSGRSGWRIQGQMMPVDDEDLAIRGDISLLSGGRSRGRADLDEEGCFTFRALTPGAYSMEGEVDDAPFAIPIFFLE